MSRIADVLQKAREEQSQRRPADRQRLPSEPTLRTVRDVEIPWQLQEDATVPEPTPPTAPREAVPARVAHPVAVERPVPPPSAPPAPRIGKAVTLPVDDETASLAEKLFVRPGGGSGARRVLLTAVDSTRASAGIALGLAAALAREGAGAVCLIDLDLDGGTLHSRLHMDGTPGVSDAILQRMPGRACAQPVPSVLDLWLMPAGSRPRELRSALGLPETQRAIRALAEAFDFVVAHVAPSATSGDAAALGDCFDGVVLVLDARTTTPQAARAAAGALDEAGVRLLGSVVNSRTAPGDAS